MHACTKYMPLVLTHEDLREPLSISDNVNGLPSFVGETTTVYHDGCDWVVTGIGRSMNSTAVHPNTVYDDEWVPEGMTIAFEGRGTADDPLCLESDLGVDFFVRLCHLGRPVWYTSPTGLVTHSGAKRIDGILGKRYCSVCARDISANNFVSQHMRMHPPECDEWTLFCRYISE